MYRQARTAQEFLEIHEILSRRHVRRDQLLKVLVAVFSSVGVFSFLLTVLFPPSILLTDMSIILAILVVVLSTYAVACSWIDRALTHSIFHREWLSLRLAWDRARQHPGLSHTEIARLKKKRNLLMAQQESLPHWERDLALAKRLQARTPRNVWRRP